MVSSLLLHAARLSPPVKIKRTPTAKDLLDNMLKNQRAERLNLLGIGRTLCVIGHATGGYLVLATLMPPYFESEHGRGVVFGYRPVTCGPK